MKKREEFRAIVSRVDFPNKGIIEIEGETIHVSGVIEGQKVRGVVNKKRKDKISGHIFEILEKSPDEIEAGCVHAGICGGCSYQTLPYDKQLALKGRQVNDLLKPLNTDYNYLGIVGSDKQKAYRNKMEYSFGDSFKDGPLALGLHKKGSFYDIVNTDQCQIVHEDFNKILKATLEHFTQAGVPYFTKKDHIGYLRHMVVRRGEVTGELLVNLVTTSQMDVDLKLWTECILGLELENKLVGILHTTNDNIADAVKVDKLDILWGQDYFYESILGMKFKISPFSFFQTNSLGAEKLYNVVREFVGSTHDKIVFDLYSGTGTITQMLAPVAKKAIGVEIVEEAVEAAHVNADLNGLTNCDFIAGDVLKVLDELTDKPEIIVLDPPREGIHPKALQKIIDYGVEQLVYVSCKPTSLVRDLGVFLENGYEVEMVKCVDMFPNTPHVETIILMTNCGLKEKK